MIKNVIFKTGTCFRTRKWLTENLVKVECSVASFVTRNVILTSTFISNRLPKSPRTFRVVRFENELRENLGNPATIIARFASKPTSVRGSMIYSSLLRWNDTIFIMIRSAGTQVRIIFNDKYKIPYAAKIRILVPWWSKNASRIILKLSGRVSWFLQTSLLNISVITMITWCCVTRSPYCTSNNLISVKRIQNYYIFVLYSQKCCSKFKQIFLGRCSAQNYHSLYHRTKRDWPKMER